MENSCLLSCWVSQELDSIPHVHRLQQFPDQLQRLNDLPNLAIRSRQLLGQGRSGGLTQAGHEIGLGLHLLL